MISSQATIYRLHEKKYVYAVVIFIVSRHQNTSLVWKTKVDKEKQSVIS